MASTLSHLGIDTCIVPIVTAGDRILKPDPDSPYGVKGLFVNEIVDALRSGDVDIAVHSAKDLPAEDPDGVVVAAIPRRATPIDVLVTRVRHIEPGWRIGTSSVRRRAQLRLVRPELEPVGIRGNVDTRLQKMSEGEVDGLVLAAAGLLRLKIDPMAQRSFTVEEMIPAPGQGAIAIQARAEDELLEKVGEIEHGPSRRAFEAERKLVSILGGGCSMPLGANARVRDDDILMAAIVLSEDGKDVVRASAKGRTPAGVAEEVAGELLAAGAGEILARFA